MSNPSVITAGEAGPPGPLPAWVTPALLVRTIDVWSEAYARPVGPAEAVESLANVERLGDALIRARQKPG